MKYGVYLYAWLISFRLKTLPLAISAVFVGNALAYWHQTFYWPIFWLTLITACLLQILSNLANDYGDGLKGADNMGRLGPKRGLHSGKITLNQLLFALVVNIMLCIGFGLWLLILACDNIAQLVGFIIIGALSIIAAVTYTIGKKPYGYIGLGDLSVLLFFGLVSVLGSFYLQTKQISSGLFIPGLSCGLLSVAVLNINNLRDYESDKMSNKRTLIVMMGIKWGKCYHVGLLMIAFCLFSLFSFYFLTSYYAWLFLLTAPLFYRQISAVGRSHTQQQMGLLLMPMIKFALMTNILYGIGIILS